MKNRIFLIPLVLILVGLTGCFNVNGNFREMRNYLLNNIDGKFKKDTEFAVGPATIAIAGFAASFADDKDGELASDVLENISKVQIGVYQARGLSKSELNFYFVKSISRKMEKKGWRYMVRSVENGEVTAVFVPENLENGVHKLFVLTANKSEIVIVEISGDLDEVVELAVRERGLNDGFIN